MEIKHTFNSRIFEKKVDQNLYLAVIDNYTKKTDTLYRTVDQRFLQLYYNIKGNTTFHFDNTSHQLFKNRSLLYFAKEGDIYMSNPIHISLSKYSKLVILAISLTKLYDFFSENIINDSESLFRIENISSEEKIAISQLDNHNIQKYEYLYLKNKLQELFIYYFSHLENMKKEKKDMISDQLRQQLEIAKQLLLNDIFNPLSIQELSKKIQIDESKLVKGFKQLYGKTISTFLLDEKIERGKEMLEQKKLKVKEIALELGYENPSHFIDAFKKRYGITPKKWMMKSG